MSDGSYPANFAYHAEKVEFAEKEFEDGKTARSWRMLLYLGRKNSKKEDADPKLKNFCTYRWIYFKRDNTEFKSLIESLFNGGIDALPTDMSPKEVLTILMNHMNSTKGNLLTRLHAVSYSPYFVKHKTNNLNQTWSDEFHKECTDKFEGDNEQAKADVLSVFGSVNTKTQEPTESQSVGPSEEDETSDSLTPGYKDTLIPIDEVAKREAEAGMDAMLADLGSIDDSDIGDNPLNMGSM